MPSKSDQLVATAAELCPVIHEGLSQEDACKRYELAEALKRAMGEWFEGVREQMTEYVKAQPGECSVLPSADGDRFYVVKPDKRKKIRSGKSAELVARCFEDMSADEFVGCLASNWAKPASIGKYLPDADDFFEEVVSEKPSLRKTMPPALKAQLQAADRAIVAEGGAA